MQIDLLSAKNNFKKNMNNQLTSFSTLTFDCYGTLIDWESGIWDAMQPLLLHNHSMQIDRQTGLEAHGILESEHQAAHPDMLYPTLLRQVHRRFADQFGLQTSDELDIRFGASVPHWPAFADTADALRLLGKHYKLVILSNVDRDGFAASARKLGVAFDAVYTAEDIGSYKPDPANFTWLLTHLAQDLGVEKNRILHTAQSLHHDHVPAGVAGLARAWIDRQGLRHSENWGATRRVAERPEVEFYFPSLMDMARAVEDEHK